ncbi:MAG: hypothetical protein RMJ97_05035 [Raineya sp.]|nr:hypothetical protein [Raineya sp.]
MILYYAVGGGMGHLTRAKALLEHFQVPASAVKVLTASPFAQNYFPDLPILALPLHLAQNPEFYQVWLSQQFRKFQFTEIWVDSFPCGILGELLAWQEKTLRWIYLARILNWNNYKGICKIPLPFEKVFLLEDLETEHQTFLEKNYLQKIEKLHFDYKTQAVEPLFSENDWLIVHSEPESEVCELLAYAYEQAQMENKKPRFCVISPMQKLDTSIAYEAFTLREAHHYFSQAGKIFTACGFNVMKQMANFRYKHHFLPFPRRFDNQFLRAKQAKCLNPA